MSPPVAKKTRTAATPTVAKNAKSPTVAKNAKAAKTVKKAKSPAKKSSPSLPRLREGKQARIERVERLGIGLGELYPEAECELDFETPFQLLIATILAAQSTDKMVNTVTPALFETYPTPAALARASLPRLEKLVHSTGFYAQKSKAIRGCAAGIVERHGGEVPTDMEALTALPGVGRKTASVVLGTALGIPAVFVDTHVKRLSGRLGLTREQRPEKIEPELKALVPEAQWTDFCHRLILHGRRVCFARKPHCSTCTIADLCPMIGVVASQ